MNNEHYLKKIFSRYIGSDYTLKSQDLKKENDVHLVLADLYRTIANIPRLVTYDKMINMVIPRLTTRLS